MTEREVDGRLPSSGGIMPQGTELRLLADLAPLADRLWLVVDEVYELGPEVLRLAAMAA